MKLLIGLALITLAWACSPRLGFVKADYDGQGAYIKVRDTIGGYERNEDEDKARANTKSNPTTMKLAPANGRTVDPTCKNQNFLTF